MSRHRTERSCPHGVTISTDTTMPAGFEQRAVVWPGRIQRGGAKPEPLDQRPGHLIEHGARRRGRTEPSRDRPVPLAKSPRRRVPLHLAELPGHHLGDDPLQRIVREQRPADPWDHRARLGIDNTAMSSTCASSGSDAACALQTRIDSLQQRAPHSRRARVRHDRPSIEEPGLNHRGCRRRLRATQAFVSPRHLDGCRPLQVLPTRPSTSTASRVTASYSGWPDSPAHRLTEAQRSRTARPRNPCDGGASRRSGTSSE